MPPFPQNDYIYNLILASKLALKFTNVKHQKVRTRNVEKRLSQSRGKVSQAFSSINKISIES